MAYDERTLACNTIGSATDGRSGYEVAETGELFRVEDYSRLKYGSVKVARDMGNALGELILEQAPDFAMHETPPEAAVIYKAVPPACHALSRYCIDVINAERVPAGLEPAKLVKVHKGSLIGFEYAASSPEEREKVLASIPYDLDGHSFTDKPVLVVDDIRITGSAERRTRQSIAPTDPEILLFGYIALFDEVEAVRNASVEDTVNHSYVHDLNDVLDIIKNDGFVLNIRTLKRILSPVEDKLRDKFLGEISDELLYDIYTGALDSGPEFVGQYMNGFQEVRKHLRDREITNEHTAAARV